MLFEKNHIAIFKSTNIDNASSTDSPPIYIIWDTFKAYIRGIMKSFSVRKKNELDKGFDKVEKAKAKI